MTPEQRARYKANEKAALAADPVRAAKRRELNILAQNRYRTKAFPHRKPRPDYGLATSEQRAAAKLLRESAAKRARRAVPETWASWALAHIGARARRTGLPFNLTAEDLAFGDKCPVLGVAFVFGAGRSEFGPSVDRIIPSLGYVKGNVCVISLRANILKRDCVGGDELRLVATYADRGVSK